MEDDYVRISRRHWELEFELDTAAAEEPEIEFEPDPGFGEATHEEDLPVVSLTRSSLQEFQDAWDDVKLLAEDPKDVMRQLGLNLEFAWHRFEIWTAPLWHG